MMVKAENRKNWVIGTIAATIISISAILVFLWQIGLFDFSGSEASAKVVAATIALVGSLLASLFAIFGILLKHSMDMRTAELLEQEQKRLEIETVIGGLRLLSTEDGGEVSDSQRAGAFLALARLGQLDFALILLASMWPQKRVDAHAAVWLINEGLRTKQQDLQDRAAGIMRDNAPLATLENGHYCWPDSLDWKINPDLSVDAREALLQSLVSMVPSRPRDKWDRESLVGLFVNLYVTIGDEDPGVRAGAVRAANAVFVEVSRHCDWVALPSGFAEVKDIKNELVSAIEQIDQDPDNDATVIVLEYVQKIEDEWLKKLS